MQAAVGGSGRPLLNIGCLKTFWGSESNRYLQAERRPIRKQTRARDWLGNCVACSMWHVSITVALFFINERQQPIYKCFGLSTTL